MTQMTRMKQLKQTQMDGISGGGRRTLFFLEFLTGFPRRGSRSLSDSPRTAPMEYFYDHETDTLSITLGDLACYDDSEEVAPGVVVHSDVQRRALAVEIRSARLSVGVKGLKSFEPVTMSADELWSRMQGSLNGGIVLRAIAGS